MTDIRPNHTGCGFGLSSCPTCSGISAEPGRPALAGLRRAAPPTQSARLPKERENAGIRMEEVLRADGSELAVAEEPDQRPVPETLADERHVVVGDTVEPLAPAGAVDVDAEGGRAGAEGRPSVIVPLSWSSPARLRTTKSPRPSGDLPTSTARPAKTPARGTRSA